MVPFSLGVVRPKGLGKCLTNFDYLDSSCLECSSRITSYGDRGPGSIPGTGFGQCGVPVARVTILDILSRRFILITYA